MANSYTTGLRLSKPALGDTGWGSTVNGGVTDLVDQAVSGAVSVAVTSATTTTLPAIADGASSDARNMSLLITGSLTTGQTATVRVPATSAGVTKLYSIRNAAGEAVTVETSGGASVSVPHDRALLVRVTSTGVYEAVNYAGSLTLGAALPATSGGTGQSSYTIGDLLYASSTTALTKLAAAAVGNVLRAKGTNTAPAWEQVDLTTDVTGILPVANGGTGAATLAANNVLLGNGTGAVQEVAPGTAGNVLTSAGGTWTSAALTPYAGPGADPKTSGTGTFTIPAGITRIKVTVVGGGGGSSGCQIGATVATGGGGGGTAVKWLTGLTPGNTLSYSVGAAGTAGTSPNGPGGAGTASTVSSGTETITTITGNGGAGGVYSGAAGNGGTATNGDLNVSGSDGNNASGGTSLFSNGFVATQTPSYRITATAGNGYGGGASAATQPSGNVAGAAGSGGLILFEW